LPQAVDASANNLAPGMFARDVNNITHFYGQFAPSLLKTRYAKEIWALYQEGKLTPETVLTGKFEESNQTADVGAILEEIKAAEEEQERRREGREEEQ
jgi:RIO kinase 1